MCGIAGISFGPEGSLSEALTPTELLRALLPASVHRGHHAYGWMYLTVDGTTHVKKFEGRSDTEEAYENMVIPREHEGMILWLVGHVRHFTHGSPKNMNNNHPIDHGKIVGVHNGVIRNHRQILAVTGREHPGTEVDSEAIFASIDKWGHRAGLRRIQGDMVAVYVNREKPQTLHIARTIGRPLVFSHTAHGGMIFASEERIAEAAIGVPDSAYSPLSTYKLIRLKAGRIVERVRLEAPVQVWRQFEGGPDYPGVPDRDDIAERPFRSLPPREISTSLSAALERANQAAYTALHGAERPLRALGPAPASQGSTEAPGVVSRPTKPARGYARSSTYSDGDVVGSKRFYKGLLLTEAEYQAEVPSSPAAQHEEVE